MVMEEHKASGSKHIIESVCVCVFYIYKTNLYT